MLDPRNPTPARRALAEDAADCCSTDDPERMELIVARLPRPKESTSQPWEPSVDSGAFFRLQITLDKLPCPIFIKNRSGRYIACKWAHLKTS
ncbi:MAG: hypothetical protein IPJ38_13520 [Dechloromonas sp.]|uniref:Uncharacterized protein n=1 Tax=Candidatus Dechloromonas phosphorivorans TaxID=2899244 RepID=A0A935K5H2_9RHOO|nr:hypothetical protein [Candidatus Dechloromonas phosphorivorans]